LIDYETDYSLKTVQSSSDWRKEQRRIFQYHVCLIYSATSHITQNSRSNAVIFTHHSHGTTMPAGISF